MNLVNLSVTDWISFVLACITLPAAVWFILLYSTDGWNRHWFGRSLMAIALGTLVSCVSTIAVRIYGFGWSGREWVAVVVWALFSFGMWARTLVLYSAKKKDRKSIPSMRGKESRHG